LPLAHDRAVIRALLAPKSRAERERFFLQSWDTPRWRTLFAMFFSRAVMSRLGRERGFFAHAESDLVNHLAGRVRHAFVELDPSTNPYLHWIVTGSYGDVLPFALRPPNVARIRRNLDRLSWQRSSLETFVAQPGVAIDRYALSDVFEYVDAEQYAALLAQIVRRSAPGARLAYWNMLVDRTRPEHLANHLVPQEAEAALLHGRDNAFFYRRFVIEDVR
jgi:S-adenosylmethionine-diacylglycerol 3-amino-3-carboxypropyl transferase